MSRSVDFLATSSSSFASTSRLPPSTSILTTDTLQSPSLFLTTQLIARTLKPQDRKGKGKVILVGISEVESEYQAILKKQVSLLPSVSPLTSRMKLTKGCDLTECTVGDGETTREFPIH